MNKRKNWDGFIQATKLAVNAESLKEVVVGVVEDVREGKWPDNTPLSPVLTAGELKAVGAFWKAEEIARDLVAVAAGRFVRGALDLAKVDVRALPPEIMVALLSATAENEVEAVKLLRDHFDKSYPNEVLNQELAKQLDVRIRAFQANGTIQ